MNNPALMELADRLETEVDNVLVDAHEYKPGTMGRSDGEKLADLLREAATQLRTAAAEGGEAVGVLDRSMPPKIWLQIDPNGDEEHRNYSVDQSSWSEISWCAESVGGQEVLYIRHDLAITSPPTDSGAGRDGEDAARYRWLRTPPNNINPAIYAACNLLMRDGYLDDAIDAQLAKLETARKSMDDTAIAGAAGE